MRLAGIDVGLKRIGMAISLDGKIVLPQNAILRKNRKQASREVNTIFGGVGDRETYSWTPQRGLNPSRNGATHQTFCLPLGVERCGGKLSR